jgi:small subunit ribosomal protein S9
MVSGKSAMVFEGSRKTARAAAVIRPGQGRIRINGFLVEALPNYLQREMLLVPLRLSGELRYKVDVDVDVKGGGTMGQAYAAAIAISRALVGFSRSVELKRRLIEYDRHLLVGDPRRTEPKKFGGPGPRRRYQKSFR